MGCVKLVLTWKGVKQELTQTQQSTRAFSWEYYMAITQHVQHTTLFSKHGTHSSNFRIYIFLLGTVSDDFCNDMASGITKPGLPHMYY